MKRGSKRGTAAPNMVRTARSVAKWGNPKTYKRGHAFARRMSCNTSAAWSWRRVPGRDIPRAGGADFEGVRGLLVHICTLGLTFFVPFLASPRGRVQLIHVMRRLEGILKSLFFLDGRRDAEYDFPCWPENDCYYSLQLNGGYNMLPGHVRGKKERKVRSLYLILTPNYLPVCPRVSS